MPHQRTDAVLHFHVVTPAADPVSALAKGQIAPGQFLNWPDARVLRFPLRVRLTFEGHPSCKNALLACVDVDAGDLKAQAVVNHTIQRPGEESDFVIRVSPGGSDLTHV